MPYITWKRCLTNQNSLVADLKNNAFDTGLGEVAINQDHPRSEGQVWREGEGEMDWEQREEGMTVDQAVAQ